MKNILVAFFAVLFLSACQDKITKPNPFIEESKMENILYDVTLLYGTQNTNSFFADTVQPIRMGDIFKKYDIDSLTFVENNRYYIALKKNVYFDMQTRVMNRLKKEEQRLDTLSSKPELEKVNVLKQAKELYDPTSDSLTSTTGSKAAKGDTPTAVKQINKSLLKSAPISRKVQGVEEE
ncbi:DUF4296 domain-containing protein [Myroides sp. DF42-4-2]|uniref:DUF4296 domain-containing protein n=1 Tax=unclassified Myroides TaxID=2642485 RepID=UPI0025754E7C|nr:DUF4296 domain-containing protein [Myroides sp. DF42-4-2]MDM1407203.1 DUF4296 domain-containing protein [Myroides sp. DF42-4-2]